MTGLLISSLHSTSASGSLGSRPSHLDRSSVSLRKWTRPGWFCTCLNSTSSSAAHLYLHQVLLHPRMCPSHMSLSTHAGHSGEQPLAVQNVSPLKPTQGHCPQGFVPNVEQHSGVVDIFTCLYTVCSLLAHFWAHPALTLLVTWYAKADCWTGCEVSLGLPLAGCWCCKTQ